MAFDYGSEPLLPSAPKPTPHRDEPAEVAKRVSDLELTVTSLLDRIQVLESADLPEPLSVTDIRASPFPDPLADPPKMLRGRDKGEKR